MSIKRWVEVSFQKEGIHKYPQALIDETLDGVYYLGYPHRHIFHFYVRLEVFHNDREVEFILLKRRLETLYKEGTLELDYQSCEMMAENLIEYIKGAYINRDVIVKVFEDDENGAILEYTK